MQRATPTRRRPNALDLLLAAAATWAAFMVLGIGAAAIVGASIFLDGRTEWWPAWLGIALPVAGIGSAFGVGIAAPVMWFIARRVARPRSWGPIVCAGAIGLGLTVIAVIALFTIRSTPSPLLLQLMLTVGWPYAIAGAGAGIVGWLVVTARRRTVPMAEAAARDAASADATA